MGFNGPSKEIYLDNNATTRPLPEVRDAILDILGEDFGNPSSIHSAGQRVRRKILLARESVASLLGVDPSHLIFTSCGTEANNLVFASSAWKSPEKSKIITSQVEHSSILAMCDHLEDIGFEITRLPVDRNGLIDINELKAALSPETCLVSIQWVNNETGVIQPVQAIGEICKEQQVPFHTDAAQAVGKLEFIASRMPIDFLSLTGHKFNSPQGIGALYSIRPKDIHPILFGGTQENGIRPGTENASGIVGMGVAANIRQRSLSAHIEKLKNVRDCFEKIVLNAIPNVTVNGSENRVCNTSNLLFEGVDGQALVVLLDQDGIRCSQSSACTNQRPEPSYVLRAMGLSEDEAYSSVRFSFSIENDLSEIEIVADRLSKHCRKLRTFWA